MMLVILEWGAARCQWGACFRHALLPRGEREEREGGIPSPFFT